MLRERLLLRRLMAVSRQYDGRPPPAVLDTVLLGSRSFCARGWGGRTPSTPDVP